MLKKSKKSLRTNIYDICSKPELKDAKSLSKDEIELVSGGGVYAGTYDLINKVCYTDNICK